MSGSGKESGAPVLLAEDLFVRDDQGWPTALRGMRCIRCSKVAFPGGLICSSCGLKGQVEPHVLSGKGRLHAWTVARVPSSLGHPAPRTYGYVDLPEDGTRIFAPLAGASRDAWMAGMRLRVAFGDMRATGLPGVWGYSFEPDEGPGHDPTA